MSTQDVEPAGLDPSGPLRADPLGYVAGLDGLRAVAVVAVLLFHGQVPGTQGGFLGVSVFFTLSGFLITSLLLREWSAAPHQRLDLRSFFSRRFRRLLPASWFTLMLVLVMGAVSVWDTEQLRDLRSDVPWSLAEALNWHYIVSGVSYGDSQSAPSPVEHFWSLAIEQQFYLLLPALLTLVLVRGGRGRSPRHRLRLLVVVFVALAAASAVANGLLAGGSIDRAYFGTDTRAAELLVGALLACLLLRRLRPVGRTRTVLLWSGPAAACALAVLAHQAELSSRWLYPWGLLGTAVCTAAVIGSVLQAGPLARALSLAPVVALGRISYGVYLLHWPVFLWLTPWRTGLDGVALFTLRIAVSVGAAAVMYRLIESPIRSLSGSGRAALRFAAPLAAVTIVGATLWVTRSLPPPPGHLQGREPGHVEVSEVDPDATVTTSTTSPTTVAPSPEGTPGTEPVPTSEPVVARPPTRVLLVGDSVAASLEDALRDALARRGVTFATAAIPGCGVITGTPTDQAGDVIEFTLPCIGVIPGHQQQALTEARPDLVVVMSTWETGDRIVDDVWYQLETPAGAAMTRRLLGETADRLGTDGAAVALVRMPDVVDGRNRAADPSNIRRQRIVNDLMSQVATERPGRVTTLGLDRIVCPTVPCPTEVDGTELRPVDGAHFDDPAGARVTAESLADVIVALDLDRL